MVKLPASMDSDVILPTEVVFENSGYCNVTPVYTQARLRNEDTEVIIFQCNNRSCVLDNEIVYYNFTSLGDVILHQPVEEVYSIFNGSSSGLQTVQPIHRAKVGHFMSTKICISRVIQNTIGGGKPCPFGAYAHPQRSYTNAHAHKLAPNLSRSLA